jgi:hypothetical protein
LAKPMSAGRHWCIRAGIGRHGSRMAFPDS